MEILLQSRWGKGVFLLALTVLSLLMVYETTRISVGATLAGSTSLPDLQEAVRLDAMNPEAHYRLALVYLYSLDHNDPQEAVRHLRQAVELSPRNASYWFSLAFACEGVGDRACADKAVERALSLDPMTPLLHWLAANYYLRADRADVALSQFRRLLELSPGYGGAAFRLCLHAASDPWVVYEKVLSPDSDPKLKLAYVNYLGGQGYLDDAYRIWGRIAAESGRFDFVQAQPFLEDLIAHGRVQDARSVWEDLIRLGVIQRISDGEQTNALFNGSFERDPLNGGFDWRLNPSPYVTVDFSDRSAYQGARCLHVNFTVNRNEEYEPVYQIVPVVPGQPYLLTAFVRSDSITSDSGPRVRVVDADHPERLDVATEPTRGTTGWHPVHLEFAAGPQTQLIRVSVWRPRSRSFPAEISGTFWMDAVSLKPGALRKERSP
jgi:tetratricopeptide (TPR) repeat protein